MERKKYYTPDGFGCIKRFCLQVQTHKRTKRQTDTQRQRDRQAHRDKETDRHTETNRQTHRDKQTDRHTETNRQTGTQRQTDRQAHREVLHSTIFASAGEREKNPPPTT
jgi:hypothetical protein